MGIQAEHYEGAEPRERRIVRARIAAAVLAATFLVLWWLSPFAATVALMAFVLACGAYVVIDRFRKQR
jgi:type II secretory pathway component PulM